MQKLNPLKRQAILAAAEHLFGKHPFHKVHLDHVAAQARVGKGTVYLYFRDKDDLYGSLILDGFTRLVDDLRSAAGTASPWDDLRAIISGVVGFSHRNPRLFELLRGANPLVGIDGLDRKRQELTALIADAIRRGIAAGLIQDPDPVLTASFIPSMVRAAFLFSDRPPQVEPLVAHILGLLQRGLTPAKPHAPRPGRAGHGRGRDRLVLKAE